MELLEALRARHISLIPERWRDMERSCTCPDWGDPCKHMAGKPPSATGIFLSPSWSSIIRFEEKIEAMLNAKRELADMTVSSGESWLARMSHEELRELFTTAGTSR